MSTTSARIDNRALKAGETLTTIAYARWTPSANAVQTLSDALGVDSVTRSAAGVYAVNLRNTGLTSLIAIAQPVCNDGLSKACVTVESSNSSTGVVTVYNWSSSAPLYVAVHLADISTASTGYAVSPIAGKVATVRGVLGGAISGADAVITTAINATPITNGSFTVAYSGSAAGDTDSAAPSAANTVAAGSTLSAATDGASTDTATETVLFEIVPTTVDTGTDEIEVVVFGRL